MRTKNPALNEKVFTAVPYYGENAMTLNGTVNKTALLLGLTILAGSFTWGLAMKNPPSALPWLWAGLFGGLITAMITIFKKDWAAITAPIYAVLEGLLLGAVSAFYETQFKGIVFMAVLLTFGTMACLLIAYRSGIIKATENLKLGITAATGGIFFFYMAALILRFFNIEMPLIHSSGTFGIVFSLVVVTIAALNLILDFDFIEKGVASGAPKYMEWYAAFGLMVTLIWLYLEILRLLAKLQSRNR